MEETFKYYYATIPEFNEALYFTVETYYQEMIPNECTTGDYSNIELPNPVLDVTVYEDGSQSYSTYKVYSDQFNYPLLFTQYSAGTVFSLKIKYDWFGSPA